MGGGGAGARARGGREVVVRGAGESWEAYDRADFRVEVSAAHASSVHRAREAAAKATARLLDRLGAVLGGPDEPAGLVGSRGSCRTAGVSIHQTHKQVPGEGSVPSGFRVSNTVAVVLRAPELAADVIDAAVEGAGEHLRNLSGPNFGVSEARLQEAERAAFEGAFRHARERAALLAREAGCTLGEVLSIDDLGDSAGPGPTPMRMFAAARGATATPVAMGDGQAVERSVTVAFRLLDAAP